jgi:predicted DNA binding protein
MFLIRSEASINNRKSQEQMETYIRRINVMVAEISIAFNTHQYDAVDYSNLSIVQNMLKHYYPIKEVATKGSNDEIVNIYLDLRDAIYNTELTEKQLMVLKLYIKGCTEEQIGKLMGGITHQAVHNLLMKAVSKISKQLVGRVRR